MRILTTGATGFVGRNLLPQLIQKGHTIIEITRSPGKSKSLYGEKTTRQPIGVSQDILRKNIEEFDPEIVIHLASLLTSKDDFETLQELLDVNIILLSRLLDALKNTNLEFFLNTGTFVEYYRGNNVFDPAYLYSATKTAARSFLDYYARVYHFKQVTVVPYTIYGGDDSQKKIIDIIYDSINSKTPVDLSPGEQVLDFIHIRDVADFYMRVIEHHQNIPGKSNFQLGTGIGTNLKQLAMLIEKVTGSKTNINWGGKAYRPSDVMYAVADIPDIDFWAPSIKLEEGIAMYLKSIEKK